MAAEEEGLHLARLAEVLLEQLVDLRRFVERIARGVHLGKAAVVRLGFEAAAVAVDGRHKGELEAEVDDQVAHDVDRRGVAPVAVVQGVRLRGGDRDGGGDRGDGQPDGFVVGRALVAQHVPPIDVRHLVAEDGGELVLVLDARQQSGVDVDRAVRIGEGVESRVLDDAHPVVDLPVLRHAARRQADDDALQVGFEERVLIQRDFLEELLLLVPRLLPQRLLIGQRLEPGAGGRDRRQLGGDTRNGEQEQGQDGERTKKDGLAHGFPLPC